MKLIKNALIAAASAGALLAVMGANPAMAGATDTFTWNPNATIPTPLSSSGSEFTANDITVGDYATITLGTNTGTGGALDYAGVVENAILPISSVALNGTPLTLGGSPYQLYFQVTATSTLSGSAASLTGSFTGLTYSLIGAVGGGCTYSATTGGTTANCGTDTLLTLATGTLSNNGVNLVTINDGLPAAYADATITAGANAGGFFVSPTDLAELDFESAFTNTPGAYTDYCGTSVCTSPVGITQVVIGGNGNSAGGGDVDLVGPVSVPVPEPQTLAMFGLGLIGMGWFVRRRTKKA